MTTMRSKPNKETHKFNFNLTVVIPRLFKHKSAAGSGGKNKTWNNHE
jgi:hypothetical protein